MYLQCVFYIKLSNFVITSPLGLTIITGYGPSGIVSDHIEGNFDQVRPMLTVVKTLNGRAVRYKAFSSKLPSVEI